MRGRPGAAERNCAASSVRDLTPSFRKMCRRWVWTVFSVTNIAEAISRLVCPWGIRPATRRSVLVSPSTGARQENSWPARGGPCPPTAARPALRRC